jgi:hypothetical protein
MYAIQAAVCLAILPSVVVRRERYHSAHVHYSLLASALGILFLAAICGIFAMAWWTVYKGKSSARYWAIFPSLTYIALAIVIVYQHPARWTHAILPLAMGIGGPILMWRRDSLTPLPQQNLMPKIAGDGTSNLLNKGAQFSASIAYLAAWFGCNYWMTHRGLPRVYGGLVVLFLVGFLNTLVHELGHTIIGLALGMRLRAFIAGPFQWRMSEGKWNFKFKPAAILTDEGATGVVPSTTHQPAWYEVAMIAAGPLTNLYCGVIALGFAYAFSTPAYIHSGLAYPFGLFGLYGLITFVFNLVPLRSGTNYSDGAKIFQLLSGGPWADFHRTVSVVTSSLVTPLQPKEYDIESIERAAQGIGQGVLGMLLRLWAYNFFLDSDRIEEAAMALEDAESVVRSSAVDLPVELHTVFVFGNAYARRDAAAARQWWDKMQAKKPTRLNVDYYRAESALHWIEGNLEQANTAWAKTNELAKKLPQAGAYEFDRTCCNLLRQAIDATPGGLLAVVPGHAIARDESSQWSLMHDIPFQAQPLPAVSE